MEMALNRMEAASTRNITTEKKPVELILIIKESKNCGNLLEELCDGDTWEWNLLYGIGNDVY